MIYFYFFILESKESVEITEGGGGKHTKRVGIHTDITFEITADGNDGDGNGTNTAQRSEGGRFCFCRTIFNLTISRGCKCANL